MQPSGKSKQRQAILERRNKVGALSVSSWMYGLILALLTASLVLPAANTLAHPLSQNNTWTITSPAEGTTVSGEVTIQGTASHANFDSYGVLYASGPRPTADSQWVPIVFGVDNLVVNGTLATWDTTELPNGQYTLALAVYEEGNTEPNLHFTNNITVMNEETTPTPSPTPDEVATEEPVTEEEAPPEVGEPPAAPTIVQPPTATPRPTPTLSPAVTGDEDDDDEDGGLIPEGILSFEAVKESFKVGVQLAFLIYAIGILYVLAKAVIRYYLRQTRKHPTTPTNEDPGL
jgi:hypothetical protein